MSYQVLAREWRPKNFDEVVGQEHVVRALTNALTQKRLHHAYLLTGTRGVGKTTLARILAKCLNCETGITPTPCGKCDSCTEIDSGKLLDLIEVDAASRTKVEDTRDLLDNVQYLPTKSRYKIYIIDEVHMLSGHSFNALLKTLEEPPEHVKFLLATTDPQKLPITVLSRCLQLNLRVVGTELIQKQIERILEKEKTPFDDQATHLLATNAKGSIRDALSLLDRAIAFGNDKISTPDVKTMLGSSDIGKIFELLEALTSGNPKTILEITNDLAESSVDFVNTIDELLEILLKISIAQLIPNTKNDHGQYVEKITQLASQFAPEEIQLYYQILLIGKRDLYLAPSPKSGFEMTMLRMLAFRPVDMDEQKKIPAPAQPLQNKSPTTPTPSPKKTNKEYINNNHGDILQKLDVTGPTQALLRHCVIEKMDDNKVDLILEPEQAPLLSKKNEERIKVAFSNHFQSPIDVRIKLGVNSKTLETRANIEEREYAEKKDQALQFIEKDHRIRELVDRFDAKVIKTDIKT